MNSGIIIGGILLLILIVVFWVIAAYNNLIRLRNQVQESWKQIDVELHRRYQLIPNLVETVKGYAAHEQSVLAEVTAMRDRAQASAGGTAERGQLESDLSRSLTRVFALAENYPDLKAAGPFRDLQAELANTEDRIAAGRRFYNSNVSGLNTSVESFPGNIIASMFSFRRAEYFEISEGARQAPSISFTAADGTLGRYTPSTSQPAAEPGAAGLGGQRGGFDPLRDADRPVEGEADHSGPRL